MKTAGTNANFSKSMLAKNSTEHVKCAGWTRRSLKSLESSDLGANKQ